MSYQALYRVWRPRTFEDVVGQSHITRTLQNAIAQEKFSHAYLFSGPRGTGKTSAAKIFAQAINCEHAPVKEPCNECSACRGILDGSISDVIEMDGASNTGVDHIREIRDKVKYASSSVPYKVYIIDEVHMITVNAFNALLKTLEEPPKHVVFILATTEPHKIPLTVISRCQRFDFKPITKQSIVERMKKIVEAEKINVTQEALDAVALAGEGGMRDSLSILDQAISYSEDMVELEDVLAITGAVSQQTLTTIVQAMHDKNAQSSLILIDEIIQEGKDPGRFVYDMIYYLRDLLLYKSTPDLEGLLERAMMDEPFKQLATDVSEIWIQNAIMQFNQCQQEMKWSNNPKVFIEVTILAITNQFKQQESSNSDVASETVVQLTKKLEQLENQFKQLKQTNVTQPVRSSEPTRRTQVKSTKNSYKIPYEKIRNVLQEAKKPALKEVQSYWADFLTKLKTTNAPAHATIQDSKPAAASDSALVVAFKYEIHCSLFLDHREMVESILKSIIQKQLTIIPIPVNEWQELRSEYVKKQEKSHPQEKEKEDSLIEEARKLVGEDLMEIHD